MQNQAKRLTVLSIRYKKPMDATRFAGMHTPVGAAGGYGRGIVRGRRLDNTQEEMLGESRAAPIVAKFMIASGLLGQFQSVDSVTIGKEEGAGDRDSTNLNQDTTSAG